MTADWLIRGGTVVDGTGAPGWAADVALTGDRIAAVGPGLGGEARRVVDAAGCLVTPGALRAEECAFSCCLHRRR